MFHKKIVVKFAATNRMSDKSQTLIKRIVRHRKRFEKHFFFPMYSSLKLF